SPEILYNRPDNTFVASFIGSPAMNFLRATSDGKSLSFAQHALPLPESVVARLCRRKGEMIVGLRPEHFVGAAADGEASALPVTVEITEQLGSETLVYFRVEGVVSSESSAADPQAGLD